MLLARCRPVIQRLVLRARKRRSADRRPAAALDRAPPRIRLAPALLGLRGGVAEPVEELGLLLGVAADLVVLGKVFDELEDAGAELVGEVRGRGPDDRVDVVPGRLGHRRKG